MDFSANETKPKNKPFIMKTSHLTHLVTGCLLAGMVTALAQTPPATGLKLWLKADAISGLSAGDPVGTWPDSSGNGFDATQTVPDNQPVFAVNVLNGKPAVRFLDPTGSGPGGDPALIDHLTSSLTLNANSNSVTAIILFRSENTGTRDTLIQPLGAGTTWLYTETNTFGGGSDFITWSFASGRSVAGASPYNPGTWAIASVVQDATNSMSLSVYRDGVLEGGAPIGPTAAASSGGWLFGANKPKNGHGLDGYIAEVLIYEGALDDATRREAEQYLADKYGLTLRKNLFTETFNTAYTVDLGADLEARQTGELAPLAGFPPYYSQQFSLNDFIEITNNTLTLTRLDGTDFAPDKRLLVTPNQNFRPFEVNGSFRLTVDISTASVDPGRDSWAGITIGGNQLIGPVPANGFAVLVRPAGGWQAFDGPYSIGFGGIPGGATNYRACLEVVNNRVKVHINGWPLVFDGGAVEHTITNLGVANYITLSEHSAADAVPAITTFDNLAISVMPEPVLPATVILADTFDTADTANLNENLGSRQSGPAAPRNWVAIDNGAGATVGITNNQVVIVNPDNVLSIAIVWPDIDFLPYERFESFRIRFKVSPTVSGTADSWAAIKLREPNPGVGVAGGEGLGILIRPGGGWQAFQGATSLGAGAVPAAATYEFDLEVRTNVIKGTINGEVIGIVPMPATTSRHYVALMSFASTALGGPTGVSATFDDFEFAALGNAVSVPAPVLFNPAAGGGSASFQFNSLKDIVYVAEYKDDLGAPGWVFLRNVRGSGGILTVTDASAPGAQRYYRLRAP